MKIVVLKFGGTSVGSVERIKKTANTIVSYAKKGFKVIVISSTGNVISAGHNLKDLNSKRSDPDNGKKYYDEIFNSCSNFFVFMSYYYQYRASTRLFEINNLIID